MVKPISIPAIEAATETTWQAWCAFLDEANASTLDHNAIVKLARSYKPISGWWAQSVAVAYEQHIGRRLPGQTSDGLFSASVSRTIIGTPQSAHDAWCAFAAELKGAGVRLFAKAPTASATPKRLYWRCTFKDGSAAALGIEAKGPDKVLAVIEHRKLAQQSDLAEMKQAWADLLDACFK